jgi:hypothetical protein
MEQYMSFVVPSPDAPVTRDQVQKLAQLGRATVINKGNAISAQFGPRFRLPIFLSKRTVSYRLSSELAWIESRSRAELVNDGQASKLPHGA